MPYTRFPFRHVGELVAHLLSLAGMAGPVLER